MQWNGVHHGTEAVMVNDPTPITPTTPAASSKIAGEPAIYRYEPSGIMERSGHIPLWLKLVALGLILWGMYYAMQYWNSWSSA
jgi:hypothetical protein